MLKKVVVIISLSWTFGSLFWWSWGFFHMINGYEITFREPRPMVALIEFIGTASSAVVMLLLIKREIKKEKN